MSYSQESDIDSVKAGSAFRSQRDKLTHLLRSQLPSIASKLYSKSLISSDTLEEALNESNIPSTRTTLLLNAIEHKIRAEPQSFTEFVNILSSETNLKRQADELVKSYYDSSSVEYSAISRYGDYLKGKYSRSAVNNDDKFPPTPSKKYINLAIVLRNRNSVRRDMEDLQNTSLAELLKGKTKLEIGDILKPQLDTTGTTPVYRSQSMVFVEGPPGIGKSTLAWELCRQWDRTQYDLAVLLRLRRRDVQSIKDIVGLFPHYDKDLQKSVAKEVMEKEGERVLFILDGYDEFPILLRYKGLFIDLMKGEVLPKSSVVVTSRPSATRDLYVTCRPLVQRHVEILGFTDEQVREYACSVFSSEPEVLQDFLLHVSASNNPAINSSMYIPLNAVIIAEIYRRNRERGSRIPISTMTQLYTQLCLTLLQRHLSSITELAGISTNAYLSEFSDLSPADFEHFLELSRLAYEKFEQQKVTFHSNSVSKDFTHFGVLDTVPDIYDRGGSYSFPHLALQEFLAAYHISRDPNDAGVFQKYGDDPRWNIVWRFVSGLTNFRFFKNNVRSHIFVAQEGETLRLKSFLLHCLFEAQIEFDYADTFKTEEVCIQTSGTSSPLDMYALGYCLAHSSSTTIWSEMCLESIYDLLNQYYISGLNSNPGGKSGKIVHLVASPKHMPFLHSYPVAIVQGIEHLTLSCLTADLKPGVITPLLFNTLTITSFECYGRCLDPLELCNVIFSSSSLRDVFLSLDNFHQDCFTRLETNTNLTRLAIEWRDGTIEPSRDLGMITKILRQNGTIESLSWDHIERTSGTYPNMDKDLTQDFNQALSLHTTLKELVIYSIPFREFIPDILQSP